MVSYHVKKLKKASYSLIASKMLSKQEKEEVDRIFRAIEINEDGELQND
jgi:hypothetical protein